MFASQSSSKELVDLDKETLLIVVLVKTYMHVHIQGKILNA